MDRVRISKSASTQPCSCPKGCTHRHARLSLPRQVVNHHLRPDVITDEILHPGEEEDGQSALEQFRQKVDRRACRGPERIADVPVALDPGFRLGLRVEGRDDVGTLCVVVQSVRQRPAW